MIIEHKKCISNKQLHQNLRKQTKERKKEKNHFGGSGYKKGTNSY